MVAYFVDDIPSAPLTVAPSRDGEAVDLTDFNAVTVSVDGTELSSTIETGYVEAAWPEESLFTAEGLYPVLVVLETAGGAVETFDVEPVVVQDADGWHTLASARREWGTASNLRDTVLYTLLSAARLACEEFAPEVEDGDPIPLRYTKAQLMLARDIHNAAKASASGEDGESFALTMTPLSWEVKALLRPRRGRPLVG